MIDVSLVIENAADFLYGRLDLAVREVRAVSAPRTGVSPVGGQ